jgi:hypothetical protein
MFQLLIEIDARPNAYTHSAINESALVKTAANREMSREATSRRRQYSTVAPAMIIAAAQQLQRACQLEKK